MNLADATRFVTAWEDAASVKDAAEACGMTERKASNLAGNLRRIGIALKRMRNFGSVGRPKGKCLTPDDVADLKLLVEKIQGAREVQTRYRGKS